MPKTDLYGKPLRIGISECFNSKLPWEVKIDYDTENYCIHHFPTKRQALAWEKKVRGMLNAKS